MKISVRTSRPTLASALFIVFLGAVAAMTGCSDHGEISEVTGPPTGSGPISLSADVQPILDANCVACHGAGGNAGLDLRSGLSYANLVDVGANNSSGVLVSAGDASSSVLYQRLTSVGSVMPPSGTLPTATVAIVEQWIAAGALDN